ncbi:MAG: hypothetical protein O7E52_10410 [Candidatus Poribacteria bacterium]|nr:hypothetical protein [Candidatus Poribacteria bacterium]
MSKPDFARTDLSQIVDQDLQFLIENFPPPGTSYEEIAQRIHPLPTALESMLNSESLFHKIRDQSQLILAISPFLLFSVLLRRSLVDQRILGDKRVINYIANLLSLFVREDRLHRIHRSDKQTHQYLTDMIQEAVNADARRQFLIYSHIGNYSLYLTGLFPQWIEYRRRYKNRPVSTQFYINFGREYYERASAHAMAREYELDEVFFRLSIMFEVYKEALNHLAKQYLVLS